MRLASPSIPTAARAQARQQQETQEMERVARRRNDMLSLLALGYGFQVRLIGQVAEAHADRPDEQLATVRPPLVAAIAGRLAPLAEGGPASTPTRWWCRCTAGPDGDRSS